MKRRQEDRGGCADFPRKHGIWINDDDVAFKGISLGQMRKMMRFVNQEVNWRLVPSKKPNDLEARVGVMCGDGKIGCGSEETLSRVQGCVIFHCGSDIVWSTISISPLVSFPDVSFVVILYRYPTFL